MIKIYCREPNEIIKYKDYAKVLLKNKDKEIVGEVHIDLEDIEKVKQLKWKLNTNGYAEAGRKINKKRYYILMHRYLMNEPIGQVVDHRDGNKLNNRKSNLRVNTVKENNFNRDIFKSYIKTIMNKVDKSNLISLQNFYNTVEYILNT